MPIDPREGPEASGPSFFRRKAEQERPQLAPGLVPGKLVGDFRLVSLIGQGGMGQVWEAEQVSLRRTVAVKFVRPERVTERQLELFAREARAGGRLSHPGIVTVHGYGHSDGLAWIAMEHVSGAWTLRDFLDEVARADELPAGYDRHVARLVAEVADAMQAAHEAGVIHRDLKPQNVLITSDEHPKVTDFGLARITDESAMSQTGDFAGTYFYMSPEQVTARRMGIDHRTDVFSLGIMLYEMLALQRPFQGDTSHQIAAQIVTKDPLDPRTLRSKVPRDLAVIAGHALEKDRERRYPTMAGFAADLRRFLAHEPIQATPPTRLDRALKWTRRNPAKSTATAIAGAAFVLIAALLVMNLRTNRMLALTNADLKSERANLAISNQNLEARTLELGKANDSLRARADELERQSYVSLLQSARAALATGNRSNAARLHALCPESRRNWEWHHMALELDESDRVLTGHTGPVLAVAFAPKGLVLASASEDGTVRIIDAGNWSTRQVFGHDERVGQLAFSPDGNRIACAAGKSLYVHDVATGASLHVLRGHTDSVSSLAFTDDGARLASGAGDGTIRVWDAGTGALLHVLEGHRGWVRSISFLSRERARLISVGTDYYKERPGMTSELIVDHTVRVWDAENGASLGVFEARARITDLTLSPDESRFATALDDGSVLIWSTDSWQVERTLEGERKGGTCLLFSPDASRLAAASTGGVLRSWDMASGRLLHELEGQGWLTSLAYSPDGTRLVSGSQEGIVRTWNAETLDPLHVLEGHTAAVTQLDFHPTSGLLATSSADGTVRIWHLDPITGTRAFALTTDAHRGFGLDAEHLFLKDLEGSLTTWDLGTGQLLRASSGTPTNVSAIVSRGETTLIACGVRDVHVDELQSGRSLHVFPHPNVVESLVFAPAGNLLVSTCDDGSLRIWSMTTGEVVQTVADVSRGRAPAFSPDGRQLAIPADETIRLLDVENGRVLRELDGRSGTVEALAFSPDGARLASGTSDKRLRIWDTRSWQTLRVLEGHAGRVKACAFSPDGTRLASLSSDRTLVIWDPEEGSSLTELSRPGGGYMGNGFAFSPDGKRILTMSGDEFLVWESEREAAGRLRDGLEVDGAARELLARVVPETSEGERDPFVVLSRQPAVDATIMARAREIQIVEAPLRAPEYNHRAWDIVDPDRSGLGDLDLALVLSSWAVRLQPRDAAFRDTLAWALFRKGQMTEAVNESQRALELAPVEEKEEYRGYLERISERASR